MANRHTPPGVGEGGVSTIPSDYLGFEWFKTGCLPILKCSELRVIASEMSTVNFLTKN